MTRVFTLKESFVCKVVNDAHVSNKMVGHATGNIEAQHQGL